MLGTFFSNQVSHALRVAFKHFVNLIFGNVTGYSYCVDLVMALTVYSSTQHDTVQYSGKSLPGISLFDCVALKGFPYCHFIVILVPLFVIVYVDCALEPKHIP